jgi:hypothetical protein
VLRAAIALSLRYLITPWAGTAEDEQRMLGRILLAFHDEAILTAPDLSARSGSNEALKVTLFSLPLEERSRIWYALEKPFKLALTYEVRVVNIDSERPVTGATVQGGDVRTDRKGAPA